MSQNDGKSKFGRIVFFGVLVVTLVPSGVFVVLSYLGIEDILNTLNADTTRHEDIFDFLEKKSSDKQLASEVLRGYLEIAVMQNRYKHANAAIAMRAWYRFMTTLFGSIVVFIGAIFVLAKIETPSTSEVSAWKLTVVSSSPGIIMIALGATLMTVPNMFAQTVDNVDGNLYLIGPILGPYNPILNHGG